MSIKSREETTKKPDFSGLITVYPGGFIVRVEIERATGGALTSDYMKNLDQRKTKKVLKGGSESGGKCATRSKR